MLRRGSSRSPPYVIVGLIILVFMLGFNYWTLSSQHTDLQQEVERLQADIKISAMKNEQSEKKNSALQDTIHKMDDITSNQQKQIKDDYEQLQAKQEDIKKRDYEITKLKSEISKMQESMVTYEKQIEEKDSEIAKMAKDHSFVISQRDDAVEAVAEKDDTINSMKRQVEQVKRELAAIRREQAAAAAAAVPGVVPGAMNIPNAQNKELKNEPGEVNQVVPMPQNGAQGVAVMEKPDQPGVENKEALQPLVQIKDQNGQREVLPVPPQGNELQHLDENLDAAIDEEENVIEDLMDDQDEEGNDIKDNPPSLNKNSRNNLNEIEDHPAGDFVDTNRLDNEHMKLIDEDEGEENQGALQIPNIEAPANGHMHDGGEVNAEDENDDNLVDTNMDERLQNLRRGGNRGL